MAMYENGLTKARLFFCALVVVVALSLGGCRSVAPIVTDTRFVEYHDTIREIRHDSVWVMERGDTIRVEVYKTRWRERIIQKTDTAYVYRVEKGDPYIPSWGKRLIWSAVVAWVVIVLIVLGRVGWWILKKRAGL